MYNTAYNISNPFPNHIMDDEDNEDDNMMMNTEPNSNAINNYNNHGANSYNHNLNGQMYPHHPHHQHHRQQQQSHQNLENFSQSYATSDSFNFAARSQAQSLPMHTSFASSSNSLSSSSNKRSFSHVQDDDDSVMKCSQEQEHDNHNDGDGDGDGSMSDDNHHRIKRMRIHEDSYKHNHNQYRHDSNDAPTTVSSAAQYHGHTVPSLPIRSARLSLKRPHSFLSVDVDVPVGADVGSTGNVHSFHENGGSTDVGVDADADADVDARGRQDEGTLQFERLSTVSIDDLESSCSRDGGENTHAGVAAATGEAYENINHVLGDLHLERERRAKMMRMRATEQKTQSQVQFDANYGSMSSLSSTTASISNGVGVGTAGTGMIADAASFGQMQNPRGGNSTYNANAFQGRRVGLPRKVRLQSNSNLG